MSETKILIVGGDSQIGSAFFSYLRRAGEFVTTTTRRRETLNENRIYLDLADDPVRWALPHPIHAALICAGITKIEACAKDAKGTARVNVEAICRLGRILVEKEAHIIYLSTNRVFDGSIPNPSPEDQIFPMTDYGSQKAEVEQRLLAIAPRRVAILRLTKVIGSHDPLLDKWMEALKKGDVIHPFSDLFIAPIPMSFVISVMRLVVDRCLSGVFHLSGDRDISYEEVARIGGWILGAKEGQIQPIPAKGSALISEPVTGMTALNIDRVKSEIGVVPPESIWTVEQFFKNPKILDGITK